jgi:O-antigen/teichoic acid export membrane protein
MSVRMDARTEGAQVRVLMERVDRRTGVVASEKGGPIEAVDDGSDAAPTVDVGHIRGSSVLLAGRMLALVVAGITQVIVVRYLSKADYGAFAYAMTVAGFVDLVATLVHRQSLTRFLSLYEEREEYDKLFGTIVMTLGLIFVTTLALFVIILAFHSMVTDYVGGSLIMRVTLVLFAFGALEAIDDVFEGMFAVFSRPRMIFFRKYVLRPVLLLAVALVTVVGGYGVIFLAAGTVLASAFCVLVYAVTFFFVLGNRGLLEHFHFRRLVYPFREVFGFGIPLITTQLVFLSTNTISVILLERMRGATEVASLRAVLPLADMNQLVIFTFTMLFLPLAARLYFRGDHAAMSEAYWESAIWLTVLTFPIFALTGPLAHSVTVFLFGARYRDSAIVLAVIAVGFYMNAALGFNALTLQTYGRLRFVALVNIGCVILSLVLTIALIPRYGALGVAIATCVTIVIQNVVNQWGMRHEIGIPMFPRRYRGVYASVVIATLCLTAVQLALDPNIVVAAAAAAVASAAVLWLNRKHLRVTDTFPELARIPVVRSLLA